MTKDALYTLDGKPPFRRVLPYSLQQVLAMFVTNMVPIGIIAAAAMPALSQAQIMALSQAVMIAAGIATFIQATPIGPLGSGLPIFMGASFTFVIPLSAIAAKYGYGTVVGTVLVGGLAEGLLGLTARWWKKAIAPVVSALVVTGIGLSLLSTAARSFGGGYAEDFGSVPNIAIGAVTLTASILWTVLARKEKKQLSILAGLAAGYLAALLFGKVDISTVWEGEWVALPAILPYRPEFRLDAILSIVIIYMVSATETLGDAAAVTGGCLHRELTQKETTGALMVDGLGSALSGLLGGTPVTSYSENVGLTIMTGAVSRRVAQAGGVMLVLAGLFPPLGRFVCTIPAPVIGGVLIMALGQILVSGFEMIARAGFTARNKLIVSISLTIAIGFTASTEAGIWNSFPTMVQTIFSQNVVAVIFALAMLLNLLLPRESDSAGAEDTPPVDRTDV